MMESITRDLWIVNIKLAEKIVALNDVDIAFSISDSSGRCIRVPVLSNTMVSTEDEQAVKKIDIDYMTDSVIVEFDPSFITKQEIKDRLEKSGYKFVRVASAR